MDYHLSPEISPTQIRHHLAQNYQLDGQLKLLPCELDLVAKLTNKTQKFIIKIANLSKQSIELDMENQAMSKLADQGMQVPQVLNSVSGDALTRITNESGNCYFFRVLTYLEGDFYINVDRAKCTAVIWKNLGQFIARLDKACRQFNHHGAHRHLEWDLAHGYQICMKKRQFLSAEHKQEVNFSLEQYQLWVSDKYHLLPQAIIHNDANDYNLLIDDLEHPKKIIGLIDFGDMVFSQRINNLSITCAYALMDHEFPLTVLIEIVKAYHDIFCLLEIELEVLFNLICLRLCTTLCNAALATKEEPNNDYLNISVKPAILLLRKLNTLHSFSVQSKLKQACNYSVDKGRSIGSLMEVRAKNMSKTLSLSFDQPLKIVRGQGQFLYDHQGNHYLDMVNNVCHVGHCHPLVVKASQQQTALLNTNTRFLHDNIVNYCEKLLAHMPSSLSVCMLVNSGSEANELALRLAKNYSQSKEIIVVDGAYHGNTNACIEVSPYKFNGPGGDGQAAFVHVVPLPDPYRGLYPGDSCAKNSAKAVKTVINTLKLQGKKPAAFICESLHGVAGQIIMPDGYLKQVYRDIRAAGGLCIADEVQVGFGRVGTHMWAFETQNVVPDIVTLGKPIGNGHPIAAVITTKKIADAFNNGMEFFCTFGGNPVSCAIGLAVLDVIEKEKLMAHAQALGKYFIQQLKTLQQSYSCIGDVRGKGLFIGVELVDDCISHKPNPNLTKIMINHFKNNNIILSSDGPHNNVFKIKPPLTIQQPDIENFIRVLTDGLKQFS